ncbi:hypothetical protein [Streptomyces longisporoflavus]|uniref:Secreted protein n=1 Tax=Streptomyces longisporoflavus TaxID=28044 RepID=A0ABW7R374_9ACTN
MTLMVRPNHPRARGRITARHAGGVLVLVCLLWTVLSAVNPTAGFGPLDAARADHTRAAGEDRQEACALIVGPAKTYCLRTTAAPPATATAPPVPAREANAWLLVPPAVGLFTLPLLRRRTGRC